MESLALLFSTSGRLSPRPFALVVAAVYALSFLSQVLISPPVTAGWGAWPFALMQALLIWTWYTLHAKRLQDAGHSMGPAIAIAILYGLAIVLLMLLLEPLVGTDTNAAATEAPRWRFAELWAFFLLFAAVTAQAGGDFFHVLALGMLALILLAIALALGFSLWAATRPSASDGRPAVP